MSDYDEMNDAVEEQDVEPARENREELVDEVEDEDEPQPWAKLSSGDDD